MLGPPKNCVVIKLAPLINCFFDVLAYFWHVSLCFSMFFCFLNWFSKSPAFVGRQTPLALRTQKGQAHEAVTTDQGDTATNGAANLHPEFHHGHHDEFHVES